MPTDVPFEGIPSPLTHQTSSSTGDWVAPDYTDASVDALAQRGIDIATTINRGIVSVLTPEDLDHYVPTWRETDGWWTLGLPGMLFPWSSPDDALVGGITTYQFRPDVPIPSNDGSQYKYLFQTGTGSVLNTLRPVSAATKTVVIAEGTCQSLAVMANTDETVAVYGIGGCWSWRTGAGDGRINLPDLEVVDGREVVLAFDADVAKKQQVHDAAKTLTQAVLAEGASKVRYLVAPGAGNVGIDDVLAARKPERRAKFLRNLLDQAPDTLGRRPSAAAAKQEESRQLVERLSSDPERPMVVINDDRYDVINKISKTLTSKLSGGTLFNHGRVISEFVDDHMEPVEPSRFKDLVAEHTQCVRRIPKGETDVYSPDWPDANSMSATLSRAREYAPLDRVTKTPFIRPDGSACLTAGYDDATKTILVLDERLQRPGVLVVPEDPQPHLEKSVRFIQWWLTDVLAKMPDEASRANYLGLLLTPLTRSFYDLAPLAVINGLAPEVGKGMSMSLFSLVALGHELKTMGWRDNDDENAKAIFSAFRGGVDTMIFDEAHKLFGKSFARALTSPTYSDRVLGVSTMAEFPNRVTWVSAGNKVQAEDTIERRTYPIYISPEGEWRNQDVDSFVIPDIEHWTAENRGRLLSALLTMVRAWHVAGRPLVKGDFSNFIGWQRVVGGILANAGIDGFLGNRKEWRSASSFDELHWEQHLAWFADTFGEKDVYTNEVSQAMVKSGREAERPPGLENGLDDPGYPRLLGSAYTRQEGVPHGDYKLVGRLGHRKTKRWSVVRFDRPLIELRGHEPKGPEGDTPTSQGFSPQSQGKTDKPDMDGLLPVSQVDKTETRRETGVSTMGGSGGSPITSVSRTNTNSVCEVYMRHENRGGEAPSAPSVPSQTAKPQGNGHVEVLDPTVGPVEGATSVTDPTPLPTANPQGNEGVELPYLTDGSIELPEGVVVFDIETTGKTIWPRRDGFIRITGYQVGKTITVSPDAEQVAQVLREAKVVVGHNILSFDLVAFSLDHGLDLQTMADEGRVIDTMLSEVLLDVPGQLPIAKLLKEYSLDEVATRKIGAGKTDDLKKLAKEFGGFDAIPINDARYVRYCAGDVDATAQVAATQDLTPYIAREHRVAAVAADMRIRGFRVDQELLTERADNARRTRKERIERLSDEYGIPLLDEKGVPRKAPHASKPGKLAIDAAFDRHGIRLNRTTKTDDPCLKAEYLAEVQAQHRDNPAVADLTQTIMELVGVRSVYETVEKYLVVGPDGEARVHPDITMYQASGRWSTSNPGLTVFGKRGGRHVEREVFISDPGELMWCADFSQLDARGVAAHCQDQNYLDNFEGGRDLHEEVAVAVFGEEARGNKELRDQIKPITHGWNYGMQINKLAIQCGDMEVARRYDAAMREQYPDLVAWKSHMAALADVDLMLDNGYGRQLRCTPGRGLTQAPALIGQAWSTDTVKEAVLRLPRKQRSMLRVSVHDELGFSIPEDEIEESKAIILDAMTMRWAPSPDARPVDIIAEGGKTARSWGGCYAK